MILFIYSKFYALIFLYKSINITRDYSVSDNKEKWLVKDNEITIVGKDIDVTDLKASSASIPKQYLRM